MSVDTEWNNTITLTVDDVATTFLDMGFVQLLEDITTGAFKSVVEIFSSYWFHDDFNPMFVPTDVRH